MPTLARGWFVITTFEGTNRCAAFFDRRSALRLEPQDRLSFSANRSSGRRPARQQQEVRCQRRLVSPLRHAGRLCQSARYRRLSRPCAAPATQRVGAVGTFWTERGQHPVALRRPANRLCCGSASSTARSAPSDKLRRQIPDNGGTFPRRPSARHGDDGHKQYIQGKARPMPPAGPLRFVADGGRRPRCKVSKRPGEATS